MFSYFLLWVDIWKSLLVKLILELLSLNVICFVSLRVKSIFDNVVLEFWYFFCCKNSKFGGRLELISYLDKGIRSSIKGRVVVFELRCVQENDFLRFSLNCSKFALIFKEVVNSNSSHDLCFLLNERNYFLILRIDSHLYQIVILKYQRINKLWSQRIFLLDCFLRVWLSLLEFSRFWLDCLLCESLIVWVRDSVFIINFWRNSLRLLT